MKLIRNLVVIIKEYTLNSMKCAIKCSIQVEWMALTWNWQNAKQKILHVINILPDNFSRIRVVQLEQTYNYQVQLPDLLWAI